MFRCELLVKGHQVDKLRRWRSVEKFFVINQGDGLQSDWISPNPLRVKHGLPSPREEFLCKIRSRAQPERSILRPPILRACRVAKLQCRGPGSESPRRVPIQCEYSCRLSVL